jgi:hypothetical protein
MGRLENPFTATSAPITGNPEFTRALIKMWIAGTMGAYFTFLFRNLALDLPTFALHQIDWPYTFGVWVRYAYLFWFLAYFFVSNVRHDANRAALSKWDIGFDLTQAIASFVAAFFLGFIVRPNNDFAHSTSTAIEVANAAIAAICLFSLVFFGYREGLEAQNKNLNELRWLGFFSSLLALGAELLIFSGGEACPVVVGASALFGAGPFWALVRFTRLERAPKS